ncbi:chemotaxis protein CheW [Pseudobutyrivibrio sp.]|uniref:chemotaxis protein CheW n=1 Tax=Pseudobutyrivibrio sp. TaxID=2014367 RepID=UPI0025FD60E5|nr:chemotaxis protein CheW [Pseudobutyrivibrio sp.]MBR5649929.1 purine-binding chemotaxis protein CheW [Pseudobutyrivibrio sp.]
MSNLVAIREKIVEEKQYIVFSLNEESFGIDISDVNSIIMMPKITSVPMTEDYISGIINLRGRIVPILSMHKRMKRGEDVITKDSRVIILNLEDDKLLGIIVDDVKEVMNISSEEIEEPNEYLKKDDSFISGVGKKDDDLISIFEVNSITDPSALEVG